MPNDEASPPPDCALCAENSAADRGEDPWFIARTATGYVRLAPTQYFPGATFFAVKRCAAELHDLPRGERQDHLMEMADVAEAVFNAYQPRKLNYEALGNSVPHLHWWLTPRYADDRHARGPIWENLEFLRELWIKGMQPEPNERHDIKLRILESLQRQQLTIERAFTSSTDGRSSPERGSP